MVVKKIDTDHDFSGVGKIIRALMNPVATDPGSPVTGEIWFNSADNRLKYRANSTTDQVATLADVTGGAITGTLWNAQSVVVAVTDDTPVPLTIGASTVLGRRSTGDITAVSFANLKTDLAITKTDVGLANVPNTDATVRANHTGTQLASTISDFSAAADARITAFVGAAPTALDTLDELAAALGDDANFAATVNTALGLRTRKFAGNYGNGALTSFTVNHALGTTDVQVDAFINASGATIDFAVTGRDANNVTVQVNTVYAAAALRIVVIG